LCFPSGTEKFPECYGAAADCGGNVISGMSSAQDCCKGDGYWFWDPNLESID